MTAWTRTSLLRLELHELSFREAAAIARETRFREVPR